MKDQQPRDNAGRFGAVATSEHTGGAHALSSSPMRQDPLKDLEHLKSYLADHEVAYVFSQDSLEQAGPDEDEVFAVIASDPSAAQAVTDAAAEEMGACVRANIPAEEIPVAVAEASYEAWQNHVIARCTASALAEPNAKETTESEIWDAYADRPAKRNAALAAAGYKVF